MGGESAGAGNVIANNTGDGVSIVTTAAPSGLVGWWRAEGNATDVVAANHGTLVGGTTFAPGEVCQGFTFPTTGSSVDIPHSANLANQQFTLEAWVRPDGPGPNDDEFGSVILQKGVVAGGEVTVSVGLWWSGLDHRFRLGFGGIFGLDRVVSANQFAPGQFYHVMGTYDGATFKLLVNGVLEGQLALVKAITYDATTPWTIGSTFAQFRNVGFPRTWNGVIDEVRIFNRALSTTDVGTVVRGNSIFDNGGLGIDLTNDGVTANDLGDCDFGANSLQNFPVLTSVTSSPSATIAQGTLNSIANQSYAIEFFSNAASDPTGFGEGRQFIGSGVAVTDAVGNASFSFTLPTPVLLGQVVSATATKLLDADSNPLTPFVSLETSEFSGVRIVNAFVPATISGLKFNDLNGNGIRDMTTNSSGPITVPGYADPWLAGMPRFNR